MKKNGLIVLIVMTIGFFVCGCSKEEIKYPNGTYVVSEDTSRIITINKDTIKIDNLDYEKVAGEYAYSAVLSAKKEASYEGRILSDTEASQIKESVLNEIDYSDCSGVELAYQLEEIIEDQGQEDYYFYYCEISGKEPIYFEWDVENDVILFCGMYYEKTE